MTTNPDLEALARELLEGMEDLSPEGYSAHLALVSDRANLRLLLEDYIRVKGELDEAHNAAIEAAARVADGQQAEMSALITLHQNEGNVASADRVAARSRQAMQIATAIRELKR